MDPHATTADDDAGQAPKWHVLQTKSRREKKLASDLAAMRISCFLPLVRRISYYGRRKAEVEVPLFAGYLFLWGTNDEAYMADRTKHVARLIRVPDQATLEWELKNIRAAIEQRAPLLPHPYLQAGIRVQVTAGPFRGLQGVVDRMKSEDRLVLQVDAFGRAVSLEIDRTLLELVR